MGHIRVQIQSENDLFDRFDADRNTLDESFIAFLKRQYDEKRDGGVPIVHIISQLPVDEERVRTALKAQNMRELDRNRLQRKRNRWTELYLFLLGVLCIIGGILLADVNAVYLQILSLTAGFAIKEAATIFFMKNPKNTLERAKILFISRSELRFERADGEIGGL